jgi:hypothetical protein
MNDWIGLGVIVLTVGGGLYWLMRANQPRELTQEEYEKRLRESFSRGVVSGAAMGLQKFLDPAAERAVAVQTGRNPAMMMIKTMLSKMKKAQGRKVKGQGYSPDFTGLSA